ncbi:Coenzyme PQQ synthesis protein E [uncultured archaeon]|nr:Coenzyme PQQ synthesis protein E [uncultured archaeon]
MAELTIEVTNNCGNRCVHCSSCALFEWDLQGADDERSSSEQIYLLTLPEVKQVLDENSQFEMVRFSGGEPFMHPLILEFLREAKIRGKQTEVLSSGVYYRERHIPSILSLCGRQFVDRIGFSLYGNSKVHAQVTRNDQAFEEFDETVNEVLENKIPFNFNFVCMSPTKDYLEETFQYVASKQNSFCNPSINFLRLVRQGNCRDDLALSREEIDKLIGEAKTFSAKYSVPVNFGCSLEESFCRAGKGKRVFTYRKEYLDCSALKYSSGGSKFRCSERW